MNSPSEILEGYSDDAVVQRMGARAGVNNEELVQVQVAKGDVHRFGWSGRVGVLELEAVPPLPARDDEIDLRSGLRAIEERLSIRVSESDGLFQREPFPRRAQLRVALGLESVPDAEQRVQDPRVAQIDSRGLDQTFADVLEPRRQLADMKRLLQSRAEGDRAGVLERFAARPQFLRDDVRELAIPFIRSAPRHLEDFLDLCRAPVEVRLDPDRTRGWSAGRVIVRRNTR